jgi:hypothetical protein
MIVAISTQNQNAGGDFLQPLTKDKPSKRA